MNVPTGRPLTIKEAHDALESFGMECGRVPLLLLMHAAVPQSFRPDLLNLLKINFLATEASPDLTDDADVLFSPLVEASAGDYYRIDPEVRQHCLSMLDAVYRRQSVRRTVEVARFMLAYADALERQAALALDPLLAEYLAIQRWVALAFVHPRSAAEALARAVSAAGEPGAAAAAMRLGSITAAVSVPLAGHQPLLAYARGVDALQSGEFERGAELLESIDAAEHQVGSVTLRPRAMLERLGRRRPGASTTRKGYLAIGVPSRVRHATGRDDEFSKARDMLTAVARGEHRIGESAAAAVVYLVGEEGAGKWTLATRLASDPLIRRAFSDGIVWLGEDGMGYARAALLEYADAVGAGNLREERGLIHQRRFRELFHDRRVLFVADQRNASDIAPLLVSESGRHCAILRIMHGSRATSGGTRLVIELAPLSPDAVAAIAAAAAMPPWLKDFLEGNTLLAWVIGGIRHMTSLSLERFVRDLTYESSQPDVRQKMKAVVEAAWPLFDRSARALLRWMATSNRWRTLFPRVEVEAAADPRAPLALQTLIDAHLIDVVGDQVRMHTLVRSGLYAIARRAETDAQDARPESEAVETDAGGRAPLGHVIVSCPPKVEAAGRLIAFRLTTAGLPVRFHLQAARTDFRHAYRDLRSACAFVPVLARDPEAHPDRIKEHWHLVLAEAERRGPETPFILPVAVENASAGPAPVPEQIERLQWLDARGGDIGPDFVGRIAELHRAFMARQADQRTRDHAVVIGIWDYRELGSTIRDGEEHATEVYRWLTAPSAGGVPIGQAHLLLSVPGPDEPSSIPTIDGVRTTLNDLIHAVEFQAVQAPRRLYLYVRGLTVQPTPGSVALILQDATRHLTRAVEIQHLIAAIVRSAPFDEIVAWIDGDGLDIETASVASLPIGDLRELPFLRGSAPSYFIAHSPPGTRHGSGFTKALLGGLYGEARGSRGALTGTSLRDYLLHAISPPPDVTTSGDEIVFFDPPPPGDPAGGTR